MSNLKAARQMIEAELKHVEQGIAFYQAKATALQAALEHIESTESGTKKITSQKQAAASTRSATGISSSRKRGGRGGAKRTGSTLPRMTRSYWLDFISQEPKTAVDIINAVIASFDRPLDADQIKKLKQRSTQALQALLNSKQIKDVGSGRQRRYFLSLGKGNSDKAGSKVKTSSSDIGTSILH